MKTYSHFRLISTTCAIILVSCCISLGNANTFPFYLTGQGASPPTSSTGFASGFITFQNGVMTLDITSYSLSSPVNEILFGFQFDPHSGASLEWPLTGDLPARGSYTSSLGINPSVAPDILNSLETDQTTMVIGTIDYPIVGQNGGEVAGLVNVVPESSNSLMLLTASSGLLLSLKKFLKHGPRIISGILRLASTLAPPA